MSKPDKQTLEWVAKQEELMRVGEDMLKRASDEALDYCRDAIDNITDKEWRKMTMSTQAVEMGVGVALVEHLVPQVYEHMERDFRKKLKLSRGRARAVSHIYIGRVIKNIRKELEHGA